MFARFAFKKPSLGSKVNRSFTSSAVVSGSSVPTSFTPDKFNLDYSHDNIVRYENTPKYGYPKQLLDAPATIVSTLSNGFKVATEQTPSKVATVGLFVASGSRYENDSNNGVAHFLEHMLFKGSKKRSTLDVEIDYENTGSHLNAYTSREHTVFKANVLQDKLEFAVESISDLVTNTDFTEEKVRSEVNTILMEKNDVESNVDEVVTDYLHKTAYQTSPLAYTILGSEENIKSMTVDKLQDYVDRNYGGKRMTLVAAGNVDHNAVVQLAEKYFGGLQSGSEYNVNMTPKAFVGGDVRINNPDFPLTHIALGVEGCSWTSPDAIPVMLLQQLLGAWDATCGTANNSHSQLAQVVSRRGIDVKQYSSFNLNYRDTGLLGIKAAVNPDHGHIDEWCYAALNEMTRLCFKVRDEDVERAKNVLKTQLLMQQDGSTNSVAEEIGRQMVFYGRRLSAAEAFARVDAVTTKSLREVAMKYIYDREVVMAAYGKTTEIPDYNHLRSWTYWLRY